MPKVTHVKKARKDNPAVKKGEPYYWWQFAYGRKQYSRTPPRRDQLTQSTFLIGIYGAFDSLPETLVGVVQREETDKETAIQEVTDEFRDVRDEFVSCITEVMEQCEESRDNMESGGITGGEVFEMLEERASEMDSLISDVESIEIELPDLEEYSDPESDDEDFEQAIIEAFHAAVNSISELDQW